MTQLQPQARRYSARIAQTSAEIDAAQALRHLSFGACGGADGRDQDSFDLICTHFLVEDHETRQLVCCFRVLPLSSGLMLHQSYAHQFYDLTALSRFSGPMVELGRFCTHPDRQEPDILRVAWGALARYIDERKVKLLFGCSSFNGTDAEHHLDAFAMLKDRYLAPKCWAPGIKAPNVFRIAKALHARAPDEKAALKGMPPLLRSYLMMGGWVSDHAVVDQQMNTMHVFTGLEIAAIPETRKRLLRAVGM